MGIKFGNLARLTGITYFRLSPYELKTFAGTQNALGALLSRILEKCVVLGPYVLTTYALTEWAVEENRRSHRKNPKDYENDT